MFKLIVFLKIGILISILNFHKNCLASEEDIEFPFPHSNSIINESLDETEPITCENGEQIILSSNELSRKIVRAQKDGPITYVEDKDGKVHSFMIETSSSKATLINNFSLPVLGKIYNYLRPNYYILHKENSEQTVPWSMAYSDFPDTQKYQTISLFEMISRDPIVIRNRDPWLPPWHCYTHLGPQDFIGVDLTSAGKYVAVSGFYKGEKAFAFRPLNYDLAGHNFLFNYQLEGQERITWKPKFLMNIFARYLGIPQETFNLPASDWEIVKFQDNEQPNILMIENGRRLVITSIDRSNVDYKIYNLLEKRWEYRNEYANMIFSNYNIHPCKWPYNGSLPIEEKTPKAIIDGKKGTLERSNQEPLFGTFIENKTFFKQPIYKVRRTFLDFLFNQKNYYDSNGNKVNLRVLSS